MRIARLESRLALLAALLTATVLALAPSARADVGETIIQRCTHGQSLGGFSQRAYSRALKELSADAEEYTDCAALIRKAQLAAASGGHGGGGGAGQGPAAASPTAASPAEQKAVARAASSPPAPVSLDGQVIHPGVVHSDIAGAISSLPTPLLATLAFLLACALLVVGGVVRNRVRAGRSD